MEHLPHEFCVCCLNGYCVLLLHAPEMNRTKLEMLEWQALQGL